ncbi:MAG: membrane protein insertion efficiency factor YidD [Candidatus Paceibacterota bacterium]|jgi:hypothetical protein
MKKVLIKLVKFYQKFLSPDTGIPNKIGLKRGKTCVFYPTCSEYSIEAIEKYGSFKGLWLSIKRISRCHPWQKNHFDPLK